MKISKTRPSMEHWAKNFFGKITPKHVQNTFGHFWKRFWAFFDFWKFFGFFENFEESTLHGTLRKKFFSKKLPENMFKTRLDTFGNDFEHFWNIENFLVFLKISKNRPSMELCAKIFFGKITPKHVQNTFGHFWKRFWAFFDFWKFFDFFLKISKNRPSMEHWAKKFFGKKYPKTCSKHVWTLLETILGIFRFLKIFWFFWKFSKTRPSMEHWAKFFFEKKNYPKTCSKHVWTLLGTILGIFLFLKIFWFFLKISKNRPSMEHCARKFFEKITRKHVQNTFGHFWERFWAFLEYWNFFDFFWNFSKTRPSNWAKKIFSEKITRKHVQNTFGHFWERFWAFLESLKFLDFFENFEDSTIHGTLGKKFFRKNYPKTCSKHVWTLLETILGIFRFLKIFWFFWKFRRIDPPWNTAQKNFFEKITRKHVQNTFGHFWERFWAFLEYWKFFGFFENFEESTLHGTLRKKFFRKNYPKTCSKHVWTLLGTILSIFGILKIFWFFWNFSKTRPSMEHWAKNFFGKITPKHVQNTFGHFWERFWAFLEYWKFFDFFEIFRRLDPPWNTGQKFFSEKLPQNMFKTRLDTFGNDFGHFWNL